MIIENTFRIEEGNREIVPLISSGFPYVCIRSDVDIYRERVIGWHWHTVYEVMYVLKGNISLKTPEQVQRIEQGDIAFINTGVLHSYQAEEPGVVLLAQLFDMHLLSGENNSVFEEKYFSPVNRSIGLQTCVIRPDSIEHLDMIRSVLRSAELIRDEPYGFELSIRNELCAFWLRLLKETEEVRSGSMTTNNADSERIKQMLDYIQTHYGEKMALGDIAAATGISVRECTRCFKRCINQSPMIYLNKYRLKMACRMLRETAESVMTISEECGFSSPSYFTKTFRAEMSCTPLEYRKMA